MNLKEEQLYGLGYELVVHHSEQENFSEGFEASSNERVLTEVIESIDALLKDKHKYGPQIFFDWITHNIFCIDKFLGTSFFKYEMEAKNLFIELKKKLEIYRSEPLLLQKGKKKQTTSGFRELKRLQSSIN